MSDLIDFFRSRQDRSHTKGSVLGVDGRRWDVYNPQHADVSLNVLAWGLAHKYRYAGHHRPGVLVADHSVLVYRILQIAHPDNPVLARTGLLHDACEAPGVDIPTPLKSVVRVPYKPIHGRYGYAPDSCNCIRWEDMEDVLNRVIFEALGVPTDYLDSEELHAADALACAIEVSQSTNFNYLDFGFAPIPKQFSHLHCSPIPNPATAYQTFLKVARSEGIPELGIEPE